MICKITTNPTPKNSTPQISSGNKRPQRRMLECGFNCLRRESLKLEDWQTRRSDATKFDLQSLDSGCRNVQEEMEQLGQRNASRSGRRSNEDSAGGIAEANWGG
jgi:hypothetical protein